MNSFAPYMVCFFQAEDGIRDLVRSRGLGDVYKRQVQEFYKHTSAGKELSQKAAGMLVFPSVVKAGIGVGGEYGEGSLLVLSLIHI